MPALMIALALLAAQDTTIAPPPPEPVTQAPAPSDAAPSAEPAAPAAPATEAKAEQAAEAKPEEAPFPPGAPRDDYGFVGWCYGALAGYLDLHDRVMPEVTRIEGAYRRPGSNLAEDLKTYDDMQKTSRANMKLFARAIEAAEKASLQPISQRGAAAIQKGRGAWAGAASLPTRTVAQQWMGWALPARCTTTATALEQRAKLMGATFKANEAPPEPEAADASPPAADPASTTASAPADAPAVVPAAPPEKESPPAPQAKVESAPTRP